MREPQRGTVLPMRRTESSKASVCDVGSSYVVVLVVRVMVGVVAAVIVVVLEVAVAKARFM